MNITRFTRNSGAAIVASIAGYASYWHQVAVATRAGERVELAHLIPLSVDGMLIVASIAMVDDRQEGRKPRMSARVAFAIGIIASVGANITAALPTLLGRTVAAWPAVGLLLVVEMLSRKGKLIAIGIETISPAVTVPAVAAPVVQAQQVIAATAATLPVPVSPAPTATPSPVPPERRVAGSGPIARRASVSPLTGGVLMDGAPRV